MTLSAALRTLCKAATALMLLVAVVAEFATKFHAHSAWVLALIPGVLAALCQILHEFLLRRFEAREAVRIERQLRESRIKAGLDPDSGEALTDAPSPQQQPIQVQIVPVKAYYVQPNGAAMGEQTPPMQPQGQTMYFATTGGGAPAQPPIIDTTIQEEGDQQEGR
ncbi:hypothetical protein [Parascardovia denticolens]|uniref:hypothetical protein n=1 Tax=Parascardovia denticolens TaxID=78258 RepID=UPI0002FB172C|nr:hypothetical protein [Parascardovia denticolens]